MVGVIIYLIVVVAILAGMWKTFEKMGQPGWAGIIPIYNIIILLQIVGKPLWWIVLFLIPFVNWVAAIIVFIDVAKRFGKGTGFAVGMVFLSFIFWPILGFGSAKYQGSAPTPPPAPAPPQA